MTLTVCLIAHNEEENLGDALESVRFAEEVIVVDCESTDDTALIARSAGARVYYRPNHPNLNINKNFSFDQATGDFILCLDADEILPPEAAKEMQTLLRRNPPEAGFLLPRRNFYFGRWLRHGGHYPDYQLRLFRRGQGRFAEQHIHERLHLQGTIGKLQHTFDHHPYRTPEDAFRKLERDTNFEAKYLYNQGIKPSLINAWRYLLWLPGRRFLWRYILRGGFLDGAAGWRATMMDLQNYHWRFNKLRQLSRGNR